MIANEMYRHFQLLYNESAGKEMGYDDTEVSIFLSLAQSDIVEERSFSNRNPLREGYEQGKKRDIELVNLKRYFETDKYTNSNKYPNSIVIQLPLDLYVSTMERVLRTFNNVSEWVIVRPVNEDELLECLNNPFQKPDRNNILRLMNIDENGNKVYHLILSDDIKFDKYMLNYMIKPTLIICNIYDEDNQISCQLDDSLHKEIVRKAVNIALASSGHPKYAFYEKEINKHF